MKKIIIIGNMISADIMYNYLDQDDRYEVAGFSVDKKYIKSPEKFGLPLIDLEKLSSVFPKEEYALILGVGYKNLNKTRETLFHRVKKMQYNVETYIHPDAKVYNSHAIGEGSIIMANSILEVYSKIGQNSVIWANCVVGHHSVVEDNCWIASGTVLAGESHVQNNCFLGVNVTVSNKVNISSFNIIGGNTAIHKNTKRDEVYISGQGTKHRFDAESYDKYFLN